MLDTIAHWFFYIWVFWVIGSGLCAMPCVVDAPRILDALERESLSPIECRLVLGVFIAFWPICLASALPWAIRTIWAISERKQPPAWSRR